MNIVLLDDIGSHNQQLKSTLLGILEKNHIPGEIALEATRFEEVLAYAGSNPPLTVYFLDIRLEQEQTGLDICRQLRREGVRDRFVFVSAYPHYALDCLKVHAYDLLIKPVSAQVLEECVLSLFRDIAGDCQETLDMRIGSRTVRIPISDIYYMETQGRKICAHTAHGVYTCVDNLTRLEQELAS